MKSPICDYCDKPRPSARPQKDFYVRDPDFGEKVRAGVLCVECANKIRNEHGYSEYNKKIDKLIGAPDANV